MNNSVKAALAACGLLGSVSYNPGIETEYLENDCLFTKTAQQLVNGWEWGISSARADDLPEVVATGTQTAPAPMDPFPPPGGNDRDPGGCGGCDVSEYKDEDEEAPMTGEQIERCEANVDKLVDRCKSVYSTFNSGVGLLCGAFSFAGSVVGAATASFCGASLVQLNQKSGEWCDAQGKSTKSQNCSN